MLKKMQKLWLPLDLGLLSLIAVVILINLPGLLGYILPTRDTMYMFQTFYFFYNDFFFSGDIPQWLPFGLYGVQSYNSIIAILSPATYFAGLIGYIIGIKNVLFLFHLSIVFEELFFIFGTYLLARLLFREKSVAFIVSLVALCGSVLMVQFLLNFHIYSLLPLVIYLLIKAFSTYSYRYIFLCMVIFIVSFFGNPPYFAPVPIITVLIIFISLFLSNLKNLSRFLRPSKIDLVASVLFFLIFLALTTMYYLFIRDAMNYTEGIYIGRDPVTLKTDLNTFLTYANDTSAVFEKFKGLVFPSAFILDDLTLHVGFVTLLFAFWGLFSIRRAVPFAFVAVILFFGIFSLGGHTPLAEFLYNYFPMMDYFRHIRDVVANYKLFIPLLAGFGLERFLGLVINGNTKRRGLILIVEVMTAIAVLVGSVVYSISLMPGKTMHAVVVTAAFLIFLVLLRYRFKVLNTIHFLIACFLFQMLSYQFLVIGTMSRISQRVSPVDMDVVSVYDYEYQNARTDFPNSKRALDGSAFINVTKINYAFVYNFLLWDPCDPVRRVDFINENVFDYFKLKRADFVDIDSRNNTFGKRLLLPRDWNFLSSIGCESNKLKLSKNVVFSDSLEESRTILRNFKEVDTKIVLNGVDEAYRSKWKPDSLLNNSEDEIINVMDFSANRLSLEVEIPEGSGAWLYYADAFHPGWEAYVNGKSRPVVQANIAFKAVFLDPGKSSIELFFKNEPAKSIGLFLIISGIIFTATVLLIMLKMCFSYTTGSDSRP